MVGKHIFVRCRNEQNNAGTWTAAMTENVADKDVVRNDIEPRCNMDETFARNFLMTCPTNNVLRIYHVHSNMTVITRTYWVTDRITETQGRKGAYSVSYILTGEDAVRFCSDYGGAFDSGCFENYDSLVARTLQSPNHRITVDDTHSVFSHAETEADSSLLTRCGFTKSSFIALMNALYDSTANKKQTAVILPESIRSAWAENGYNTAEKLGYLIFRLLPDFMRMQFGMVSHWSCQVKDKMMADMPLIFVHPKSSEDIAYLKRENVYVVDTDRGEYSEIPSLANDYFSFIWDNLSDYARCEEFWAYAKTNFKLLLRARSTDARAMECIYRIRETTAEKFSDPVRLKKAFLSAAYQFAGAGKKIPLAETFLSDAVAVLKPESGPIDSDIEAALCRLLTEDTETTAHQAAEYKILLRAVENGTASSETVKALCGEITKENRNAVSYFLSYLADRQKPENAGVLTRQMTELISGLFVTAMAKSENASFAELIEMLVRTMSSFGSALSENNPKAAELLSPFADAYIACIRSEKTGAEQLRFAYDGLFRLFYLPHAELHEKCSVTLQKEEARLYKAPNAVLSGGERHIDVFADAFFRSFEKACEASGAVFSESFERLFRLMLHPSEGLSEKARTLYRDTCVRFGGEKSALSDIVPTLLSCEENALSLGLKSRTPEHTQTCVIALETIHLAAFKAYYPSEERLSVLLSHMRNTCYGIYPLFVSYAERMPFAERQGLYHALQNSNMLIPFSVYVLLYTDHADLRNEIDSLLQPTYEERLKYALRYSFPNANDASSEKRFLDYCQSQTEAELDAARGSSDAETFMKQFLFLLKAYDIPTSLRASPFAQTVLSVLYAAFTRILGALSQESIGQIPPDTVRKILWLHSQFPHAEHSSVLSELEVVRQLDDWIVSTDTAPLYAACERYGNSADMRTMIRYRLELHLRENTCGVRAACLLYDLMLKIPPNADYPLDEFLQNMDYNALNGTEKGVLLLDIMLQLHKDHAAIERPVGKKIMYYLELLAENNPEDLLKEPFLNRWRMVRAFDYTRGTGFVRIMGRAANRHSVKFDLKMFLLCLGGLLAVLLVSGIFSVLILKSASFNSLIAVLLSALLPLAVIFADVILFVDFQNSKNRRKNK